MGRIGFIAGKGKWKCGWDAVGGCQLSMLNKGSATIFVW